MIFSGLPPVFLAPMAGISDAPFRRLCREQGADGCVTEMVSAKALYYHNRGTEKLLKSPLDEGYLGLQLFGSDPEILAEMAQKKEADYDFIDLNMGCPMPKIVGNGEGSALLEKPQLAERIISTMARTLAKPLSVKIRIGVRQGEINGVSTAVMAEKAGAAMIFVHGRTRSQLYSGKADWQEIKRIKDAVSLPVIGNGDVDSGEAALRLLKETGCDGLMIGRAARGNPWIFREVKAALKGGSIPRRPDPEEMMAVMERHILLEIEEKGESVGCRELRKHLAWYTAGMSGGAALRKKASAVSTLREAKEYLKTFAQNTQNS